MTDRLPDPITVVISREEIAACDPTVVLGVLTRFVESARHPAQVRGRLRLAFHGYDNVAQELWEIGEVRAFVRALDDAFPFWFYLTDLKADTLKVLAFCLCRITVAAPGATAIHHDDWVAFFARHFGAMNQLLAHWRVSEEENHRATDEIALYFERAQILN